MGEVGEMMGNAGTQALEGNFVSAALGLVSSFINNLDPGGPSKSDKDRAAIQSAFLAKWPEYSNAINTMQWDKIIRPQPGVDAINPAIAKSPEYSAYMAALRNVMDSRTAIGSDASQSHSVAWDHVNRIMGTGPYNTVPGHWPVLIQKYDDLKRKYDPQFTAAGIAGGGGQDHQGGGGGEPDQPGQATQTDKIKNYVLIALAVVILFYFIFKK